MILKASATHSSLEPCCHPTLTRWHRGNVQIPKPLCSAAGSPESSPVLLCTKAKKCMSCPVYDKAGGSETQGAPSSCRPHTTPPHAGLAGAEICTAPNCCPDGKVPHSPPLGSGTLITPGPVLPMLGTQCMKPRASRRQPAASLCTAGSPYLGASSPCLQHSSSLPGCSRVRGNAFCRAASSPTPPPPRSD